jgi:oxaloacetate decarboxylase gamma subunit
MTESILSQGVELMLFGMGTVFVFLTLLVVCTGLMSAVIGRLLPEPTPAATTSGVAAAPAIDPKVARAIAEAISQHRKKSGL